MNIPKTVAGIPTKYLVIAAIAGIALGLYLHHRNTLAAADNSNTDPSYSTDPNSSDPLYSGSLLGGGGYLGGYPYAGNYPYYGQNAQPVDVRPHAKCTRRNANGRCVSWTCPQGVGKCR